MRKILIVVLIVILITCAGFTLFKGFKIGNIEISSIMGLADKSKQLDTSISELKQMREVSFSESIDNLEKSTKELADQKQQYASLVGTTPDTEIMSAIQSERYEVEYLWVKLGNHATKNGITLKMDITNGGATENKLYNLKFTATGNYANVTEFIYEVENDSTLGFKIENFSLLPSGTTAKTDNNNNNETANTNTTSDVQNLLATFLVKNVYIDLDKVTNITTTDENTNTDNSAAENTIQENNEENVEQTTNSVQ